jgi:uncharacterized protein DUF2795
MARERSGDSRGMALQVTEVQKALRGADYPASREELAELADSNGADDEIVEALRSVDAEDFDGPDDVMASLKGQLTGSEDD